MTYIGVNENSKFSIFMAYLITCLPMHKIVRFANTCVTSLIVTNKAINAVIPTFLIFIRCDTGEHHEIRRDRNSLLPGLVYVIPERPVAPLIIICLILVGIP